MKNITLKLSFLSIFLLSTILFSCKEEPPVRSGDAIRITNSGTFSENPLEWVGEQHNILYESIMDTVNISNWDSTWVDESFKNYLIEFIDFPNSYMENLTNEYLSYLGDYDSLTNKFINEVTQATHISSKEKYYALRMINFSIKSLSADSIANYQEIIDSIYAIESDIMNETWDSSEVFAFFCISMMKHSYEMHIDNFSISNYGIKYQKSHKNVIKNKNMNIELLKIKVMGNKVAASVCGLADWTVGSAAFLASTSATVGLGAVPAAYAGFKIGTAASSIVGIVGAHLDWWDIELFG